MGQFRSRGVVGGYILALAMDDFDQSFPINDLCHISNDVYDLFHIIVGCRVGYLSTYGTGKIMHATSTIFMVYAFDSFMKFLGIA